MVQLIMGRFGKREPLVRAAVRLKFSTYGRVGAEAYLSALPDPAAR